MKKVVFILLAIVAVSVSSCQKENQAGQATPAAPKGLALSKNLLAVSKNKKDTVPPSATFTRLRDTVPPSKAVKDTVPPSAK